MLTIILALVTGLSILRQLKNIINELNDSRDYSKLAADEKEKLTKNTKLQEALIQKIDAEIDEFINLYEQYKDEINDKKIIEGARTLKRKRNQ